MIRPKTPVRIIIFHGTLLLESGPNPVFGNLGVGVGVGVEVVSAVGVAVEVGEGVGVEVFCGVEIGSAVVVGVGVGVEVVVGVGCVRGFHIADRCGHFSWRRSGIVSCIYFSGYQS